MDRRAVRQELAKRREELAGIAGMAAKGVPMLTDDGDPVPDPRVLRRAMEYANK